MNNRMYCKAELIRKRQFHRHNARFYTYEFEDGGRQIEFWSYSTPMIVRVDGQIYLNERWYSSSTTRQVNRFCGEYSWDLNTAIKVSPETIRQMCR